MTKKIIALIASAAVVTTGGVAAGGVAIYNNQPEIVAKNAIVNFVEDLGERDELSGLVKALNGGSFEFSASSVKDKETNEELLPAELHGKVYMDKEAVMFEDFSVESDTINVSADAYFTRDFIYINESEILGGAYGIVKGEMADDFADSIFAYGSGSMLSIPDEAISDSLVEMLRVVDKVDDEKLQKDAQKLFNNYIEEFYKITIKTVDFEDETKKVKLGSERKNARVITIEIDDNDVDSIVKEFINFVQKDKELEKFVEKYDETLSPLLSVTAGLASGALDEELSFSDYYDMAMEELDAVAEEIEIEFEGEYKIEIVTPKASSKLLKLSLYFENEPIVSLDLNGKGIKDSDKITLKIGDGEDARSIVYKVKENNSKTFSCEVSTVFGGETKKVFSFVNDKKAETFKLNLYNEDEGWFEEVTTIDGDFITKSKATTITLKTIKVKTTYVYGSEDSYAYKTDIKLVIDQKDKIPVSAKKAKTEFDYDRISDITDEDIVKIMERVGELGGRIN